MGVCCAWGRSHSVSEDVGTASRNIKARAPVPALVPLSIHAAYTWRWCLVKCMHGNLHSHSESLAAGVSFHLVFFFSSNFPPETPAPGPGPPSSTSFLLIDLISSMSNKRSPFCGHCSDKRSPAVDHQNKQLQPIQLQGWALAFIWLWHHFNQNVK